MASSQLVWMSASEMPPRPGSAEGAPSAGGPPSAGGVLFWRGSRGGGRGGVREEIGGRGSGGSSPWWDRSGGGGQDGMWRCWRWGVGWGGKLWVKVGGMAKETGAEIVFAQNCSIGKNGTVAERVARERLVVYVPNIVAGLVSPRFTAVDGW